MGLKKTETGFVVLEGENGVVVDEAAAVDAIQAHIEEQFNGSATTVEIPVMIDKPEGSAEELAKVKSFKIFLATLETDFLY